MRILGVLGFLALLFGGAVGSGAETVTESPELMLFQEIPSMLTKIQKERVPASVTVITAEQIKSTPARNIYDLLEVYVPGAVWLNHHESPHVGIRGVVSDRNYKHILLVNGRRMNQDAHSGGEWELENWDLNDIQRIEVIRGPGSVTYGPGAIAAVINLITKNADTAAGTQTGVQYVYPYDSKALYVSEGLKGEWYKAYFHGSVARTSGILPREYVVDYANRGGYLGEGDMANTKALYYFNDADQKPQVKLNAEFNFLNEWQAWIRYSNTGTSRHGAYGNFQTQLPSGDYANVKENKDQGFVAQVKDQHNFGLVDLKSTVSYSSLDHQRRGYNGNTSDINSMQNINHRFAENQLLASVLASLHEVETVKVAAGVEYAYKSFVPGWGSDWDHFRIGDSSNIFGSPAGAAQAGVTSYVLAGKGWQAYEFSYLAEANYEFVPQWNLIASGRLDDHEFTPAYFSPRVALVTDQAALGMFKAIWQQSLRMNTEEQLYLASQSGAGVAPEKLNGGEFIYQITPIEHLDINASAYYNVLDIVGWSTTALSSNGFATGESRRLGLLKIWGFDLESKWTQDMVTVGLMQSYAKQIEFLLDSGQTGAGISYADFNYPVGGSTLRGTGNDLNNWPNWSTKLYTEVKPTAAQLIHLDARVYYGYEGAKDGLAMLENAVKGTANEAAVKNSLEKMRAQNVYQWDLRLNASYRYSVLENLSITIYAMNVLNLTGNKRYSYDSGLFRLSPYRSSWVEEPLTLGTAIDYRF